MARVSSAGSFARIHSVDHYKKIQRFFKMFPFVSGTSICCITMNQKLANICWVKKFLIGKPVCLHRLCSMLHGYDFSQGYKRKQFDLFATRLNIKHS